MATTRLMHDGSEKDTESNTELGRLFQEYLDAADAGRDVSEELLARAGAARDQLGAKMRVHRELCALSRSIGERSEPEAPEFLGRFRVLDSLGRGGLSRVLLAQDIKLGRQVALKLLARDELPDKEKRAWVLNEARSLATLEHSGVVRVYEVDESGSQSFIAMELLSGPSLGALVTEWRRVRSGSRDEPASAEVRDLAARLATTSAKVELLAGLAEALAYCHDHRVLHRDIKPENVQFDALGRPKLIDFGLAHMSDAKEDSSIGLTQALVGTAAYIAPEQVSSDRTGADPQSDQFSFGTLAYECLALENPFQRATRRATLDAVEAADPEPLRRKEPSLPPDLALVVHHALERLPGERYPTMSALAADLRAIQQSRPLSIRPPSLVHVGRLWLQRHRRGVRVASVVMALAAAAWAFSFGMTTRAEHERLLEQLAAIQPESFSGTKELLGSFEPLFHLQSEARGFDAGFLRAGLWGPLTPEVRRTVEAWSRSLSLTFARENRESAELGVPMQDLIYRQLFWEDEKLWPESPFNVENRSRGTVAFPRDELKEGRYLLTLLTPLFGPNGNSVFLGTTLTELLVPGYYRLQVWDDGAESVRRAVCFNVPRGWPDRMRIELHEPRPELLERSIPFDRTTCPITAAVEKGGQIQESQQDLHVGSFALLDDLVTVKDFEKFLALARPDEKRLSLSWPGQFQHSRAPDASAICSYEQALEFAAWAGGRLPTSPELLIAESSGLINVRQPTQDASGEFLCGCLKGIFSWLCYSRRGKAVDLVIDPVVDMVGLGVVAPGFRIVFDLDEPEFYTHTATHPIAEK